MHSHKWQEVPISFVTFVHLSSCINTAPSRQIFVKFNIGDFYENLSRTPNLVKIRKQCQALYTGCPTS